MPAKRFIWIAVKDPVLREVLAEQIDATPDLEALPRGAEHPASAPRAVLPDAALVDAGQANRYRQSAFPVILIGDAGAGQAAGSIRLPLRVGDLVNRIHASVRESRDRDGRYWVGGLAFEYAGARLCAPDGAEHALTPMEADLLLHLCRAGERLVSRDELLRSVWGYSALAETGTVETHVWQLRSLLDKAGCRGALQRDTEGYRLTPPPVRRQDSDSQ